MADPLAINAGALVAPKNDVAANSQSIIAPNGPLLNTVNVPSFGAPVSTPSKTPVSVVSSSKGVDVVQQQKKKADSMTPVIPPASTTPVAPANTTGTTAPNAPKTDNAPQSAVTFVNPNTDQEITINSPSQADLDSYKNAGWSVMSGTIGSGFNVASGTNPAVAAQTAAVNTAKSARDSAVAKLTNFNVDNDPALASLLKSVASTWDARIADEEQSLQSGLAATETLGYRIGSTQYTGGKGGVMGSIISGKETDLANKISSLNDQKNSALSQAKYAYETQQWTRYNDLVNLADKTYTEQQSTLKDLVTAQKEQDTKIQQAKSDSAVASLYRQGTTDPAAILAQLRKDGNTTTTLSDIGTALKSLIPAGVDDLVKTAQQNGASPDVIKGILGAKDLSSAYAAAGKYAAGGTGLVGEYNYAKANGYSGSFTDYQQAQANMKANATAAANGTLPVPVDTGIGTAGVGHDILGATGLSYNAFLTLTGQMSSLPRDQKTRNAASAEVAAWAKKNGVDVSTLSSQYKALNDVLSKNIERSNQTKIMGGEVLGTADALIKDMEANTAAIRTIPGEESFTGMSSLRAANVLNIMAGNATNNKFAQAYSTQLQIMGNDLAGYLAASRGSYGNVDDADKRTAASIIANGMNKGSIQAFKDAITSNESKVTGVVSGAVTDARKGVWDLFGVGDKYQEKEASIPEQIVGQDQTNQGRIASWASLSDANGKAYEAAKKIFPNATTDELMNTLGIHQ